MALSRRALFRSLLAAPVGVYAVMKGIAAPKLRWVFYVDAKGEPFRALTNIETGDELPFTVIGYERPYKLITVHYETPDPYRRLLD